MPTPALAVVLYYREGNSDKEYRLSVDEVNGGYAVNFAYGKRGAKLRTGTKTPAPVSFLHAKIEYNRVIAEKTGEGYKPGPDGPPLDDMMQTRQGRQLALTTAMFLQQEFWSRNYTHSWGVKAEWATLLSEHPEILDLPPKEAADTVLANLAEWSPELAAKERKARGPTEEELKRSTELGERLKRARINEVQIGPPEAQVSICQFKDDHLIPPFKEGIWGVISRGIQMASETSESAARTRADRLVELAKMRAETSVEFPTADSFAITMRLVPKAPPEATVD